MPAPAVAGLPETLARVRRSVVLLIVESPEGVGSGTGFAVARRGPAAILATNHHVSGDSGTLLVRTEDGRTATARVLRADPAADLALLEVAGLDLPPLPLARAGEAREGAEVGVLGYPRVDAFVGSGMGIRASLSRGVVSAVRERDGVPVLQVDAGLNPGNSGGPAFDYRSSRVVGVATASLIEAEGIGLLVRSDALGRLMEQEGLRPWASPSPRAASAQPARTTRRLSGQAPPPEPRRFPRTVVLALFLLFLLGLAGMAVAAMRSQPPGDAPDDRPIL